MVGVTALFVAAKALVTGTAVTLAYLTGVGETLAVAALIIFGVFYVGRAMENNRARKRVAKAQRAVPPSAVP